MTRPSRGLAATLWKRKSQSLKHQLDPAVGLQLAHANQFGTGGYNDGGDGNLLVSHKKLRLFLSLAVLEKRASARNSFYGYILWSHCWVWTIALKMANT